MYMMSKSQSRSRQIWNSLSQNQRKQNSQKRRRKNIRKQNGQSRSRKKRRKESRQSRNPNRISRRKRDKTQLFEDMEDEDENIDLGDEKDQVLAQMKKSLKGEQETELAFVVENFKAKTNELFHEISEMNPAEIEETVKCHVQAQLDESGWHGCGDCGRGSSG